MKLRSTRVLLAVLFCAALLLRVAFAVREGLNEPPAPGSDAKEYDAYAWNVAQGNGYRGMSPDVADQNHLTAYRTPLPSVLWAGFYAVLGHRYDVIRVLHCLLGAAGVFLVYGIGRRTFDETVGLVSAGIYAIFPTAIYHSVGLLSEPLGNFLFLVFILTCLRFANAPEWRWAAAAGVLLGLLLLTRAAIVFMVPLLLVWAVWQFRDCRRALALACAIPVVAGMTMSPWVIRNYLVFERFVPFASMGGSALLQGNNRIVVSIPRYYGYAVWDTRLSEYREALKAPNDEFERDRIAKEFAVQWLLDNPDQWWFLAQAKFRRAWTPFLQADTPAAFRYGMLLAWGPVLLVFGLAFFPTLWVFLKRRDPSWLLHMAIFQFVINSLIFSGNARYRTPIEPLCLIIAVGAVAFILRTAFVRQQNITSRPAAAIHS